MTPLLDLDTLALIARQEPLQNEPLAAYCIDAASATVAEAAKRYDWVGEDAYGNPVAVVPAPRRVVTIAEQLAMRSYLNPDAIVAEGGIGPIGGDRKLDDFARPLELTEAEKETLAVYALGSVTTGGLFTLEISNRPPAPRAAVLLPDLDPRADAWMVGDEDTTGFAYTPKVI